MTFGTCDRLGETFIWSGSVCFLPKHSHVLPLPGADEPEKYSWKYFYSMVSDKRGRTLTNPLSVAFLHVVFYPFWKFHEFTTMPTSPTRPRFDNCPKLPLSFPLLESSYFYTTYECNLPRLPLARWWDRVHAGEDGALGCDLGCCTIDQSTSLALAAAAPARLDTIWRFTLVCFLFTCPLLERQVRSLWSVDRTNTIFTGT